ncbi:putative neural-cadherin 2 [Oppia nitens]|uniref:putative neural-cadherin 2 n=1 Tax=Oppia nitens TaxID=1686743 RepID=UPI0023D9E76F|nr:putative neural-cadherin 2 [Oppia nitens]XP_054154194.1 putative neural-cadherin 2 [Oppia nitens]XP_054154195.1 putative neural-cadherin 2 [Oppia nitens]XP_054154196.1 putative neural-cadherin 2 [Oppia nitens]XP_054154197.1 putative neural-cadherin 2 [Oppia nitens]
MRSSSGDANHTFPEISTFAANTTLNGMSRSHVSTLPPKELQEFIRRRYGLQKQPSIGDIWLNTSTGVSPTQPTKQQQQIPANSLTIKTSLNDYKYRVVSKDSNNNTLSYSRFHFSDDQNIDRQSRSRSRSRPTFEIKIIEEDDKDLPKRLLQVTVSDDKYQLKDVIYTFNGDGVDLKNQTRSKFAINSTSGEIYALCALDRDQPFGKPQWKLSVYAKDAQNSQLVGFADVIVNLKDINDNPPVFIHKHFWANVTENSTAGQYITKISATDADDPYEGNNAKITYNIKDNQVNERGELIFGIDSNTGVITTEVCCLDRELHSQYKIKVIASDGEGLKATTTVTITVNDVNDMSPKFTKHEWFADIDEIYINNTNVESMQSQMPILIVTVIDLDLFETNNFSFKIIKNNAFSDHFSLTANTDDFANSIASASLKVIKTLDYEDINQRDINLTIGVSDIGPDFTNAYHTDYCVVYIRLRDINDNYQQFVNDINHHIPCRMTEASKLCACPHNSNNTECSQTNSNFISNFSTIAISAIIFCLLNIPLIIALVLYYIRYKRKVRRNLNRNHIDNNDESYGFLGNGNIAYEMDEKTSTGAISCDCNNKIDNKLITKRVHMDPNSVIINFNDYEPEMQKNLFSPQQHIGTEELADIIRDHIERIDLQMDEPIDNVCIYAVEGSENNTVCSLSSLSSLSSNQYNIVYTIAGNNNNKGSDITNNVRQQYSV